MDAKYTERDKTMAKPIKYDNNPHVTMASEPAIAYMSSSAAPTAVRSDSMSVDEYFDKVRKALEKRYEKSVC